MIKSKNHIVKSYIVNQIQKRIYKEGQLIESETRLCEILQVSRMTLRKALDELVNEGIVYKEKGRGTFVANRPKYASYRCGVGFSQEATKRGLIPSSKDVKIQLCEANEEIANKLGISIGDQVWKVTRIRCVDQIPVIYVVEYYVHTLCPDLNTEIANQSIYSHLEEKGITFAFADQTLQAVACPKDIAKKLGVEQGHPLILMNLIVYMKNGVAFNYGNEYYRSDQFMIMQPVYNQQ